MTTHTNNNRRLSLLAFIIVLALLLGVLFTATACGSDQTPTNVTTGGSAYPSSGSSGSSYDSGSDPSYQSSQQGQACSYAHDEGECNASSSDGASGQYWNGYSNDDGGDSNP